MARAPSTDCSTSSAEPRVAPRDLQRHARPRRRPAGRRRRDRGPPRDLRWCRMSAAGSKCRVCKAPAVIDLPRHNANFCAEHLQQLCRRQMAKAIEDFDMFGRRAIGSWSPSAAARTRLAVWDMLIEAGYQADGLYIGLGIGEYSDESGGYVRRFADERGLHADHEIDLRDEYGYDIPTAARRHRARAVLGLRAVEAPPVRPGRARWRLRRRRDRPQPRRRGGGAVRQHAALGHRLPRSTAARAAGRARVPEQGQAAGPPDRAGDGGVVRGARHRLPGRGVPDGGGQPAPRRTRRR